MNKYNHLLLSALLHDIGKFYWRAGITGSPQNLFKNFIDKIQFPESIDKDLLLNLISKPNENIAKILEDSDKLSYAEEYVKKEEPEAGYPLIPIFSDIDISKGVLPQGDLYYEPKALDIEVPFPSEGKYNKDKIKKQHLELLEYLNQELKKIPSSNFEPFFETLYFLLKKYTSTIALSKTEPDIALFDHLKTTTAIAACLYENSKEKEELERIYSGYDF